LAAVDTGPCLAEVIDRIVAVVNEEAVSLSELTKAVQPYADKIKTLGYPLEKEREMLFKIREEILEQLVSRKLAEQESRKYKLSVSEKEIDNAVERVKEANHYTDEDLRRVLANDNMSLEEYRGKVRDNIMRSKLVTIEVKSKIVITKEDVRSYYESHNEMYRGEKKYHLKNLVGKAGYGSGGNDGKTILRTMEEIYGKLKNGLQFDAAAREYSVAPHNIRNFDLGTFKSEELSRQIMDAVKDLKAGESTNVLETEIGYQIIYVQMTEEKPGKSLVEATPEIEEILFREIVDKKFMSWINELKQKSHVKIIK
jgi:peptidyl-prolyl cis-trans isomerase SurA